MRGELRRMQRDLGITFIHVTHTQPEAIALAGLVVVMDHGHIEQAASAYDVYAKPLTAYVARFVGGQNVVGGRSASCRMSRCPRAGKNCRRRRQQVRRRPSRPRPSSRSA